MYVHSYLRLSDNGNIVIKVSGSANTTGDYIGGAAVGWKF
ncbi:hypothetical protein F9B74_01125 [Pelistega sp. NLN82]|uniref:Uncharacterized protein n=1 Tax=Pelistega ratti TaxID=2652177 RepID=A0A6L9Y3G6_9BURK|nr:YadA-like family protein [Pelistega ratti]NEN74932.1 hypothetical protein [Pelistega ratti]